jgi:hypothetical protein
VDFDRGQIVVHDGKGFKDRVTVLPEGASLRARRRGEPERDHWQPAAVRGLTALPAYGFAGSRAEF